MGPWSRAGLEPLGTTEMQIKSLPINTYPTDRYDEWVISSGKGSVDISLVRKQSIAKVGLEKVCQKKGNVLGNNRVLSRA